MCSTCYSRSTFPIALTAPAEGHNYQTSSRDTWFYRGEHQELEPAGICTHKHAHSLQNIQRGDAGGWEWHTEVSGFRVVLKVALSRADITESTHRAALAQKLE